MNVPWKKTQKLSLVAYEESQRVREREVIHCWHYYEAWTKQKISLGEIFDHSINVYSHFSSVKIA